MQLIKLMVMLWVLPWLTACQSDEPAFKVGINRWLGYEPLYLAKHLEFYPDVDIVRLSSTLDVMRALRNGNLQAAGLTLDEALLLINEGIDLDIVLVLDYSNGADMITAAPGIQSLLDIKGKRIGVEMNAAGALLLHGMLGKAGVTIDQVKIESMPVSHLGEAYAAGRIDMAVSYQPYAGQLVAQGMQPIFSSADMPGQIVDVLVVRHDSIHRDTPIRQMIDGFFRTQQFLVEHPDAALQRMSHDLGREVSSLQRDLDGIHWLSPAECRQILIDSDEFLEATRRMTKLMRELGMLHHDIRPQDVITSHWLDGYRP